MQATPNEIAAFLYLASFNVQEGAGEIPEHETVLASIQTKLRELKYPEDPLFDNDGWPMLDWGYFKQPGEELFDPESWFENLTGLGNWDYNLGDPPDWVETTQLGKSLKLLIDDRRPVEEVLEFLYPDKTEE